MTPEEHCTQIIHQQATVFFSFSDPLTSDHEKQISLRALLWRRERKSRVCVVGIRVRRSIGAGGRVKNELKRLSAANSNELIKIFLREFSKRATRLISSGGAARRGSAEAIKGSFFESRASSIAFSWRGYCSWDCAHACSRRRRAASTRVRSLSLWFS